MLKDFTIGSLSVYEAWGVVTAVLFAAIFWLVARRASIAVRDSAVICAVAIAALYLGSRLYFELVEFTHMPGKMWVSVPPLHLRILRPLGFTFLGGLAALGILAAALGLSPAVKPGPGRILDVLAGPTALSFTVSKVGCVLAGCCYGRPTDAWWSVSIAHMHTGTVEGTVPVRLLEMGISAVLGGLALWALFRPPAGWRLRHGTIFAGYLAAASLARFAAGFGRGAYEIRLGGLDAVQWGGLVLGLAGAVLLTWLIATRDRTEVT